MNLKSAELINKGMSQDFSISKNSQEFAFENHNIRIITNDDSTSMSITNIQGPKKIENIHFNGVVLGKCVLDKYVVIFTHSVEESENPDCIYRLDCSIKDGESSFTLNTLFEGNLNFSLDFLIDTIYFLENNNVIKVYWTDGLNNPRFINIITPGERVDNEEDKVFTPYENAKIFDFYPVIDKTPKITLSKDTQYISELSNGMAQYFVSYYNENGAETLIAASSVPITTDHEDRGSAADDPQGSCSVILNITNIDKSFDFVRIYSAIRTSESGELIVKIVKDVKINEDTDTIEIIDNGINQESIAPEQLFYIGGQILTAKTLTQKDGTLFLGNLTKSNNHIPEDIYESLNEAIRQYNEERIGEELPTIFSDSNVFIESPFVEFKTDKILQLPEESKNLYYPYKRQVFKDVMNYRTFKCGEIYRFGLQFQSAKGEWTDVMWIGDAECSKRPIKQDDGTILLNNATLSVDRIFTSEVKEALNKIGLVNYRLVMADPIKHNGRKIKAQGVLCPSLFNLRDRYMGKYANASWIMRPREGKASYHHLEPLVDYKSDGAEIVTNYTNDYPNVTYDKNDNIFKKVYVGITYIPSFVKHCIYVKYVEFESEYIDNHMYDFTGSANLNIIKQYDFKDSVGLSKLLDIVSEAEKAKIPAVEFSGLYNDDLRNFLVNFAKGLVIAISGATQDWLTILTTTLSVAISTLTSKHSTQVTPNLSESKIKELLGDASVYDSLKFYEQGMIRKNILQQPIRLTKLDIIQGHPISEGIEKIFSDVSFDYWPWYSDGNNFVEYGFFTHSLPLAFRPSDYEYGDRVYFQLYEKATLDLNLNTVDTDYYVDESVLSLHSPDITEDTVLTGDYKCKMIGYVPLSTNNYLNAQIEMSPAPYGELGGLSREYLINVNNGVYSFNPFYSGLLYKDLDPNEDIYTNYRCYLFGPGDIVGPTTHQIEGSQKSIVQKKQTLNHLYSKNTVYFDDPELENSATYDVKYNVFIEDPVKMEPISPFNIAMYEGNHSNAFIVRDMEHIHYVNLDSLSSSEEFAKSNEMINIDFSSTPHVVLSLVPPEDKKDRIPLLPILGLDNPERYTSIRDNRISSNTAWERNALSENRILAWNTHYSALFDTFVYVDNPYLLVNEDIYSHPGCSVGMPYDALFSVLQIEKEADFKDTSSLWEPYTVRKAIGINYLEGFYENNDNSAISISNLMLPSTFNNIITGYYNTPAPEGSSYKYYYRCVIIVKYLKQYYEKFGFPYSDFLDFIVCICDKLVERGHVPDVAYTSRSYNFSYFFLGLLYFFNTSDTIHEYYSDSSSPLTTKFYLPSLSESDNADLINYINNFRYDFVDLYKYCSCLNQLNNNIGYLTNAQKKSYRKVIETNISETYNKLIGHLNSIIAIQTEEGWNDTPYAKSWNDSDYPDGNTRFEYYLSPEEGTSFADYIEIFRNTLKDGYQDFLRKTYTDRSIIWRFKYDTWIYSFNINPSTGNYEIIDGYDNSKGALRYNGDLYRYDDSEATEYSSGKLVKFTDEEADLYYQDEIDYEDPKVPYLMLAELYNDIPYNILYGGHSLSAIRNLTWFPISEAHSLNDSIEETFGDTYYQRFDCLKTYPKTEEDINQNVDITSFMVESHINLDDRTDPNRGNFNLMSRPSNFNLFNPVYSDLNNIFVYQTKSSDLITDKYPNQFVWTLSKNYLGDVDTWTNASFLSLNQCKYPITKLCNYNDKLISLNTKSLEYIDFNSKAFVAATNGFIELQNNSKVQGTIGVSDNLGTSNSSVQITEKGIYFVEDNEHNIIRLNQDGSIVRIGMSRMESWMKKNITIGNNTFNNTKGIHLEYDPINKELHILNDTYCLIYNETIESFTSFIDLKDTVFLFTFNGKLWSLGHLNNSYLYGMYSGIFNTGYDSVPIDYSLHYRVNPEMNVDKVFTNIEFIADLDVNNTNSNKSSQTPFNYIQVWNEYQDTGLKPLSYIKNYYSNLKQKFRIWRADIPRNSKDSLFKRDRIRNPWIHLFVKKTFDTDDNRDVKMELHNLNIQYMS